VPSRVEGVDAARYDPDLRDDRFVSVSVGDRREALGSSRIFCRDDTGTSHLPGVFLHDATRLCRFIR